MTTPRERHARFRAQHASQHLPSRARKPVAMLTVERGNPFIRLRPDAEKAGPCKHGYLVCKPCWQGHLGPRPETPAAPPPAPVAGEAPSYEWARCVDDRNHAFITEGRVYPVLHHEPGQIVIRADDGERSIIDARRFEPAPSPAVELEWTPEASGWEPFASSNGKPGFRYRGDALVSVFASAGSGHDGEWYVRAGVYAPTVAQAACAALGITLHEQTHKPGFYCATDDKRGLTGVIEGAESCARAAIAAHHARGAR